MTKKSDNWIGRVMLNALLGISGLVAANIFGLGLGVTAVNITVASLLGIPGLALLAGIRWLF